MQTVIIISLVLFIAAVAYFLISHKSQRTSFTKKCPSCRKAWVPGRSICPFCGYSRLEETISPSLGLGLARLVCIQGPQSGRNFPIASSEFTVGRSSDNRMRIEGNLVSRHHALIVSQDDQYILYDRESTNGTWVNGRRISQHVLQRGDQIQIGPSVFVFEPLEKGVAPPIHAPKPIHVAPAAPPSEVVYEFGDYVRTETIGTGGAATVYKGVCHRDGKTVAIKILHHTDPYIRDKFEQEWRIGQALRHPHVVKIYGGGQSNGTLYIVMEYVDNGSLRPLLIPGRSLPLEQIIPIIGETCDALNYAHRLGVYHRDIKPENIMFSSKEGVKLVDFGIAKLASSTTRTSDGMIVGTSYYMSYEQARGRRVDGRSDIYSLGVVLYEVVTGQLPFTGEPMTVIERHIREEPVPPRRINKSIPAHVEGVIMRALEKDIERRFQTAEEMARALGYTAPMFTPESAPLPLYEQRLLERESYRLEPAHAPVTARLVIGRRRSIPLSTGVTLLCRRDVAPSDMRISREHARIFYQGGHFWLEDLNSTNGTFLNDQRIFERALLQNRDKIRMGKTMLRFEVQ